jgi:DNA polymerase I-like protein with 3'-5' exonuclease and polymerase domains
MSVQLSAFPVEYEANPLKQIVTTGEKFEAMIRWLKSRKRIVVDYETSGIAWFQHATYCGIGLAGWDEAGRIWNAYVPVRHHTGMPQLSHDLIAPAIKDLLEDPSIEKVGHNIKFEDHFSRKEGWHIRGPRYDTMVAARLYNDNEPLKLEKRAELDLGIKDSMTWNLSLNAEVEKLARLNGMKIEDYKWKYGYSEVDPVLCGIYCCTDTDHCAKLRDHYEAWGVSRYYPRIWATEMRLTEVLCDMEQNGMPVDVPYLQSVRGQARAAKETLESKIHQLMGGYRFNVGSDDELRATLFHVLGLRWEKRTKGNQLAVDREVLEGFSEVSEVCRLILAWRDAEKIDTTYTTSIIELLDGNNYVHGNLKSAGTATGRLSCSEPNYQNISNDDEDRSLATTGKKLKEGGCDPWSIRRAFPVREVGSARIYLDYCLDPETLVETTRGLRPIRDIAPGDKVYSLADRRITWGEVSHSVPVPPLPSYEITFDNGQSVIASSDHRWPVRLRDGHRFVLMEKRTEELRVGERMVPMRRCTAGGYTHLYAYSAFEYTKEHLLVAEAELGARPIGHDVHHKNGLKSDNAPDNLEYVSEGAHLGKHSLANYANQDHTLRVARLREALKSRDFRGSRNPNYGKRRGEVRACLHCDKEFYVYPSQPKKYCSLGCYYKACRLGNNHKIVAIRFVGLRPMHAITVPAHHNFVLGCGVVTYNSQIELRVLAYYSKDPIMVDAYLTGQDLHERTAKEISGIRGVECSRRVAKAVNFGLAFCLSEKGLATQTKISVEEATLVLQAFFKRYAGVSSYRQELWAKARREGCQWSNIFGRTRRLPDLKAQEFWKRKRAERQMIGSAIQGTAAELTKESLVRIADWFAAEKIPALLVNTVHDEIQIDTPRECLSQVVQGCKRLMEAFPEFHPIPIIAEPAVSYTNWAEKVKYKEESGHG